MTPLRSLVAIVATAALAACSSGPALPGTDPQIDGVLIERLGGVPFLGAPMRVLVQENPPRAWDRTIVDVGKEASVYLVGRDGGLVPADAGSLAVGDRLRVWITGSDPGSDSDEVTATRVYIIR